VPLTGAAVETLRVHLARQMEEIGDEYEDKWLVFASQTGNTVLAPPTWSTATSDQS
jgi:hypothetical protein